jgi:hypothetical protein
VCGKRVARNRCQPMSITGTTRWRGKNANIQRAPLSGPPVLSTLLILKKKKASYAAGPSFCFWREKALVNRLLTTTTSGPGTNHLERASSGHPFVFDHRLRDYLTAVVTGCSCNCHFLVKSKVQRGPGYSTRAQERLSMILGR